MYAFTLFVLTFFCLIFGAANASVIPNKNGASDVSQVSKVHFPREVVVLETRIGNSLGSRDFVETAKSVGHVVFDTVYYTGGAVFETAKSIVSNDRSDSASG